LKFNNLYSLKKDFGFTNSNAKDVCDSAINEIKNIKSGEIDLLIELAKYICYREK